MGGVSGYLIPCFKTTTPEHYENKQPLCFEADRCLNKQCTLSNQDCWVLYTKTLWLGAMGIMSPPSTPILTLLCPLMSIYGLLSASSLCLASAALSVLDNPLFNPLQLVGQPCPWLSLGSWMLACSDIPNSCAQ